MAVDGTVFSDLDNTVWDFMRVDLITYHNHQLLLVTCLLEIFEFNEELRHWRRQRWHPWSASLLCLSHQCLSLSRKLQSCLALCRSSVDQRPSSVATVSEDTCRQTNDGCTAQLSWSMFRVIVRWLLHSSFVSVYGYPLMGFRIHWTMVLVSDWVLARSSGARRSGVEEVMGAQYLQKNLEPGFSFWIKQSNSNLLIFRTCIINRKLILSY